MVHVFHNNKPWVLGPFVSIAEAKRRIAERDPGSSAPWKRVTAQWADGVWYDSYHGGPGNAFEIRRVASRGRLTR